MPIPCSQHPQRLTLHNQHLQIIPRHWLPIRLCLKPKRGRKCLSKSYYPRFNLQGSFSGRGSGANPDGTFGTGTDGLDLMRHNWAVGLTATFSVLDFPSLHFKKQIEQSNERAQRADYDKTIQTLTAQAERAKAAYDSAVLISQNTPVELRGRTTGREAGECPLSVCTRTHSRGGGSPTTLAASRNRRQSCPSHGLASHARRSSGSRRPSAVPRSSTQACGRRPVRCG